MRKNSLARRSFLRLAAGAAALPALAHVAQALAYPNRPVLIVVGTASGGAADTSTRLAGYLPVGSATAWVWPTLMHRVELLTQPEPGEQDCEAGKRSQRGGGAAGRQH